MTALIVHQFGCRDDNYGFLLHDPESGETVAIDTPDGEKILSEAAAKGWNITQIWNTHWHPDHAWGNKTVQEATGCTITAPAAEDEKIEVKDRLVRAGVDVRIGAHVARVLEVPGHTSGHIAYHLGGDGLAFVGDVLFALGCGRVFEGTMPQMWDSLKILRDLPEETVIYCAHEYTAANADFAITIEPDNPALQAYVAEVREKRARGEPTVPTRLDREIEANPFLRADVPALQTAMGHPGDAAATFGEIRLRKDNFKG